jgi:hypothetical protein
MSDVPQYLLLKVYMKQKNLRVISIIISVNLLMTTLLILPYIPPIQTHGEAYDTITIK